MTIATTQQLPEKGFVRLRQLLGDKKANPPTPPIIPIGRTSWLNGVKSGKYPRAYKLGERTTAWKVEDIRRLIDELGGAA
ncbi:MAG: helix-turn-helix transcriptional regulator [Methylobacter sp.]